MATNDQIVSSFNLTVAQIGADIAELRANGGGGSGGPVDWASITNKPTFFSGAYGDLTGKPVLFSGAYGDLTGKPVLFSGSYLDLTNRPSFSTVATSGSYNDLLNRPTLFSGSYTDLTNKPSLGTLSSQNANTVAITGGSVTGITDLTVADGGTGASTAAAARSNLGVAIGTDVQAYDPDLSSFTGITDTSVLAYRSSANTWVGLTLGTNLSVAGSVLNAAGGGGSAPDWPVAIASVYWAFDQGAQNQQIPNQNFIKVNLPTKNADTHNAFNTTTSTFTVPTGQSGYYSIVAKLRYADSTGTYSYGIGMGGSLDDQPYFLWSQSLSSRNGLLNERIAWFNAGDQIFLYTYQQRGQNAGVQAAEMSIYRIK